MKKQLHFFFTVCITSAICHLTSYISFSQNKDAVLMTIGNDKVTVDEFLSIYKKNNNKDGAALDKKSIEEYLDLYTIFRLKVKEAKEMGIDTSKAFRDELAGYRKTLAQPYLTEKEAVDNLVKESYDRMKWDIRTSHILVKMDADPTPEDTMDAYTRISLIRDFINGKMNAANMKKYETNVKASLKISKTSPPKDTMMAFNKLSPLKNMSKLKAHDFASVAKVVSDHGSKVNGGDLGYFTSMAQGYPYEYENAAYKAKQGEVYGPIRTPMGYHLVLVTDKRAHKELHLEHLMFLFKKNMTRDDSVKMKMKIDSISGLIKKGENFEELAKKVSDHKETAKKGGDIGWLSIGSNFPPEFKEVAFAIKDNGLVSDPVKTRFGWHIIKRIGNRELPPFDSLKIDLKGKIQKDARNSVAKEMMIAKVKTQYGFKEVMPKNYTDFYSVVDSTLPMGQWKAEKAKALTKPMFTIIDKTYTQQDFAKYIEKNYRMVGKISPKRMVDALYKPFVDEVCSNTRENRLEQEYPEFKLLMNEYSDGILLFNLTDQKVWSKAIKDTTGAKEYYAKNKEHFLWEDRLDASIYTCKDEKTAEKVKKMIKGNKSDKDILSALNKDTVFNVMVDGRTLFLKGDNAMLDKTNWTPGITASNTEKNKVVFANIRKIVKPTPKSYTEARGLVTSEYQSWLEKEWISSLKKKYPVAIDRKVFDTIQ
ncbi:MAG: peptidylprolyl isomerase [Bacteroidetes bacterium]|nr:peptidylprolyl isomerase [Bacteroidota bacterium]